MSMGGQLKPVLKSSVALSALVALATLTVACGDKKAVETTTTAAAVETTVASSTTAKAPAHWTYEGEEGPSHWGELDPAYALCADGSAQTPIDVTGATGVDLPNPVINYSAGDAVVVNNGHTIQLKSADGNTIAVDGVSAPLKQIHFHTPSEHTINGKTFPAEVHFVHITDAGVITVLGVMITEGAADNAAWAPYVASLGTVKGTDGAAKVDWAAMLPSNLATYRYAGSLTTPPCTEGVNWLLLETPVELSAAQIQAFEKAYTGNARPVQPLNGRTVQEDTSSDK